MVVVGSSAGMVDMLSQLLEEQRTWQLVLSLYRDRLNVSTDSNVKVVVIDNTSL